CASLHRLSHTDCSVCRLQQCLHLPTSSLASPVHETPRHSRVASQVAQPPALGTLRRYTVHHRTIVLRPVKILLRMAQSVLCAYTLCLVSAIRPPLRPALPPHPG